MARGNSLYAKLTRDLIPQYNKRVISDDETIQMLLSMLYQHTGIDYGNKTKAYSEGYEVGRVETRRTYEGKRYTEAEMDKHGQGKYQQGYQEGKRVQETVKRSITSLFPTEAAVTVVYDNGYQDGVEEGKRQYDWLRKQAEAKYKDLKVKYDKLEQETKAIEKHSDTAYDKGYLKGKAEGVAIGIKVKDEALNEYRKDGHNEGYLKGIEDGTKGKEKFAADRAEESYKKGHRQGTKDAWQKLDQGATWEDGYQQGKRDADAKHQVLTAKAERQAHDAGFADGYAKGKQQGKKEVVDFINNMKVSQ